MFFAKKKMCLRFKLSDVIVWLHQRSENRMERLMPLVSHFYCRASRGSLKSDLQL